MTAETNSAAPPPALPPSNPYGPFQSYGSYAPPGGYGPPYGYGQPPVAPSYPPPGYLKFAQSANPAYVPARKKPHTKLIIGIVVVVIVVLVACSWGVVATVQALRPPALAPIPHETPTEIYSNDFSWNAAGWADTSNCFLKDDGYHVTNNHICYAPIGNYSDIDVRVQVKQISGPPISLMGIAFRILDSGTSNRFYLFGVTANGRWGFEKCGEASCTLPVSYRSDGAINNGLGMDNTLEVYAKGSRMDFFINGKLVGNLNEADFSTGMIGLASGDAAECVFINLYIGELG